MITKQPTGKKILGIALLTDRDMKKDKAITNKAQRQLVGFGFGGKTSGEEIEDIIRCWPG